MVPQVCELVLEQVLHVLGLGVGLSSQALHQGRATSVRSEADAGLGQEEPLSLQGDTFWKCIQVPCFPTP